jgi:ClpP class serine protease
MFDLENEVAHLKAEFERAKAEIWADANIPVEEKTPEVVARCSDIARTYRRFLAKTASGKDPLVEEAFARQAEVLAAEVAGENASALEVLLAERIGSLWALTELQEALMSAYYGGNAKNVPPSYLIQMAKLQESANRRYLSAIKALAQGRKLQVGTPAVHLTQNNLGEPTRATRLGLLPRLVGPLVLLRIPARRAPVQRLLFLRSAA